MVSSKDYDTLPGLMTGIEQQSSEERGKVRFLTFSCKYVGGRRKRITSGTPQKARDAFEA